MRRRTRTRGGATARATLVEPRQERSRDTLRRILSATRRLLRTRTFEDLTVADVAAAAGCSVGAFYERFPTKQALLPHLLQLHYAEVEAGLARLAARHPYAETTLEERARDLIDWLVRTGREQRGLIRALVLRNQRNPGSIPPEIRQAAQRIVDTIHRFLLAASDPPARPRPEVAVQVGLLMVMAAIRERIVLADAPQAATLGLDDGAFAGELGGALVAYLRATPAPGSRR